MEKSSIGGVMRVQEGVVSRAQVLAAGLGDNDIERLVRRREWAVVHPGVYVSHTGPLPWIQRVWAALLAVEPAVLAGPSALRAHGLRPAATSTSRSGREDAVVHVAVERDRHVKAPPGVRLVRRTDLERRSQSHLSPPRLRVEDAVIDVAEDAVRESDAVAVVADACQQGLTTPERLIDAVRRRRRLKRRRLLTDILDDVAGGVRSVLERRYVVDVERPHGLPTGRRQRRLVARVGSRYRDVEYSEQAVVVELDGRLVHASVDARWADLERDIDSAVVGDVTVRLGWEHVVEPCRSAAALARLLRSRGWLNSPTPCSAGCPVTGVVDEP